MWITAITLGLVGSFHCLTMCSPLVMAVTAKQGFNGSRLVYNAGRISTYAILGSVVGAIGEIVNLPGFQNYLSVASGAVLIALGVFTIRSFEIPHVSLWVRKLFARFLQRKGLTTTYTLGMLNGLLPCGLTSIALAYCISLDAFNGSLYMLVFGLSTLPAMLGFTAGISKWLQGRDFSFKNVPRIAMIVVGVLLIARPYVYHGEHVHQTEIPVCETRP